MAEKQNNSDKSALRDAGIIPPHLLYAAVVVGLALIFCGIGLLFLGQGSQLSALMTCVGFGLVLAAFGSNARGEWAGWTVAGAAALAIVLFLILQQFPGPLFLYKKGQLRGEFSRVSDIRIIDEEPMYEYRDKTTSSVRFILLDKKLKSSRLSVQVDTTEKGDGREFFELTGDAEFIQRRYLAKAADHERQIQWAFDYDKRVIRDGHDVIFSERDSLEGAAAPTHRADGAGLFMGSSIFFSPAYAQDAVTGENSVVKKVAVKDLIENLKSDDASERRNARDALSSLDESAIPPMMEAFRSAPENYRIKLGILVALDDMIRRASDQRTKISAALKAEDFPLLVAAASDDDKTIRLQAADFLYVLQDPRAVPASIEAARETTDSNKATNQILIIQQSAKQLSSESKANVLHDLTRGPGANNDLIGSSRWLRGRLGF